MPERRVRNVSPERTPGVTVLILSVRYQNEAARKRDALTVSGTFDNTIIRMCVLFREPISVTSITQMFTW